MSCDVIWNVRASHIRFRQLKVCRAGYIDGKAYNHQDFLINSSYKRENCIFKEI